MRKIYVFIFTIVVLFCNNNAFSVTFKPFENNQLIASVIVTEEDTKLFENHGMSYDDVSNTVNYYRKIGLSDAEIQNKIDTKINNWKIIEKIQEEKEDNMGIDDELPLLPDFDIERNNEKSIKLTEEEIQEMDRITGLAKNNITQMPEKQKFNFRNQVIYKIFDFIMGALGIGILTLLAGFLYYSAFLRFNKNQKENKLMNKEVKNNLFLSITKQVFNMCRTDVFYTLFLSALVYNSVYVLQLIILDNRIGSYSDYHVSFVICKWIIFISSLFTAYKIFKENNKLNSLFIFGCITIVFNPIFKIAFDQEQWIWIMIITSLIYLHFFIIFFISQKHSYFCNVCNIKPLFSKLFRIHIYTGGFKPGDVHFDSEIYICKKCYDKCKKCDKCGQLKMTDEIKQSLGQWETIDFCYCDKK